MIFFESWAELGRTLLSALLIYPFIVLSVRVAGKRSTSKMNNFDWIVTVALGSIVGSTVILKSVVLLEAYLAVGLLIGLQFALTKATVRWPEISWIVRDKPTLLFYEGTFNKKAMRRERVTPDEIRSGVREAGYGDLGKVRAVILEADSSFSVLGSAQGALENSRGSDADLLHNLEGRKEGGST